MYLRLSWATSCSLWPCQTILEYFWISLAISNYVELFQARVISGYFWLPRAISGYVRYSGCLWLSLAILDYLGLPQVNLSYPKLSLAISCSHCNLKLFEKVIIRQKKLFKKNFSKKNSQIKLCQKKFSRKKN